MKIYKHILVFAILIVAFCSCQDKNTHVKSGEVKYSGVLRTIMSGNVQPTISLDTLSGIQHLYAVGAAESLKGEIQIFDGIPSNSFVVDSILKIKDSYDIKASLLVYVEVDKWNSFKIEDCKSKDDLEVQIFKYAMNNKIDIEKPFPFLLEGTPVALDWHVINWKEGDTIHSHQKHQESGLYGTLRNKPVSIIGFYSTKHKAIFTHHTTNMHMHFKTEDNAVAGHVDDLLLNESITLKLPK